METFLLAQAKRHPLAAQFYILLLFVNKGHLLSSKMIQFWLNITFLTLPHTGNQGNTCESLLTRLLTLSLKMPDSTLRKSLLQTPNTILLCLLLQEQTLMVVRFWAALLGPELVWGWRHRAQLMKKDRNKHNQTAESLTAVELTKEYTCST